MARRHVVSFLKFFSEAESESRSKLSVDYVLELFLYDSEIIMKCDIFAILDMEKCVQEFRTILAKYDEYFFPRRRRKFFKSLFSIVMRFTCC